MDREDAAWPCTRDLSLTVGSACLQSLQAGQHACTEGEDVEVKTQAAVKLKPSTAQL